MKHWLTLALFCLFAASANAQGTADDYRRADELPGNWQQLIRNDDLRVRWDDQGRPIYAYTLDTGTTEWRTVNLDTGAVSPAFDQQAIALALAAQGIELTEGSAIEWFDFLQGRLVFLARNDPRIWTWDSANATLTALDPTTLPDHFGLAPTRINRTRSGGPATHLLIVNATDTPVLLSWLDHEGLARQYATIAPGASHRQHTYTGHTWRIDRDANDSLGTYVATEQPGLIFVRGRAQPPAREPRQPRRNEALSPDGRFQVSFDNHQVVLTLLADSTSTTLTTDGSPDNRYEGSVRWSPDSALFVVMRTTPGFDRTVHIVESSPADQVQPKLISFNYRKPGDAIEASRPMLFDAEARAAIAIDQSPIENPWEIRSIEWAPDSTQFYYLYNQRGHQTLRYVAIDATTGTSRIIVNEQTDTFFDWTNKIFAHRIDATSELIWMSERSGWNHLYLIDLANGSVKNAITTGQWVVRGVDRIDNDARQLWLRVMGTHENQDPYHIHYARVDFDGSNFTLLTQGDGTHRIDFSPNGNHYIDRWSRVDLPPVTELRRTADGSLLATLAHADHSALLAAGWNPPERFVAKGRDGTTDIWGFIQKPTNFNPSTRYPVIESIYAGPHGHHVPKDFAIWRESRSIAELGFITVHIDGMGTNWRSKAFHDVAHKDLKDAGFPDRIAWLKAASQSRTWMDLSRVGIYGVSAGGQNALAALLFHNDFYHAAVADCGCHDNRMDKIWWNEQWMGSTIDDAYIASSNVANAHKLKGHLLLTVGEIDQNVDPASTMQVVNALIKADKDFELIVFPGLGHGTIGSDYGKRRMRDFFVRTLHNVQPRRTQP